MGFACSVPSCNRNQQIMMYTFPFDEMCNKWATIIQRMDLFARGVDMDGEMFVSVGHFEASTKFERHRKKLICSRAACPLSFFPELIKQKTICYSAINVQKRPRGC